MALSDCIECWSTPCECGFEYKNYTHKRKIELASAVLGVTEDYLIKNLTTDFEFNKKYEDQKIEN